MLNTKMIEESMELLTRSNTCSTYKMGVDGEDGTVLYYSVCPGISVMYNNFHIEKGPDRVIGDSNSFSIHYCMEGRIEAEVSSGEYLYLGAGDVLLEKLDSKYRYCSFPTKHYHGITITFSPDEMDENLNTLLLNFSIDINRIKETFLSKYVPFVIHEDVIINHIFEELYKIPELLKYDYLKLKVIELLMLLRVVENKNGNYKYQYFYKSQIEKVKDIKEFITNNIEEHFTMEELSQKYDIPLSTLKKCFKAVYGEPIYQFIRNYRMNIASTLLIKTDDSIIVIAGKVGYTNSSKFTEAFKSVIGKTPTEYRKTVIQTE